MAAMTHRERVLAALEHRQPDRLPLDLGSARVTGIVRPAYDNLRARLGFGDEGIVVDRMQQIVQLDERVLEYLDVDVRAFAHGAPDQGGDVELDENHYRDEWGVTRRKPPGCHYYELAASPLAGDITARDIARYPWPDPTDPGRFRGLRAQAERLRKTPYAVMFNARFFPVHLTQYLRGFEDWYLDLGRDHDLFRCLMDAAMDVLVELNRRALAEVGGLVDIVSFGDDVGLQDRAVCALPVYRKLIRPAHERVVNTIRENTPAKIFYHTCGSVYAYIEDFIEMGIDALNPVQVSARNMEPERLKREFGGRIAFWGGVDSQRLMPLGAPDEVRAEVRRLFEVLGPGGGYVLANVHNIQPDVPPDNILALFEAGRACRYAAA
jgi:uroporphyrinogen decarboxylase